MISPKNKKKISCEINCKKRITYEKENTVIFLMLAAFVNFNILRVACNGISHLQYTHQKTQKDKSM